MSIVSISSKKKRVQINEFEIENDIVFEYFNKIPAAERDDVFTKAIYIGVLALMEDRISAFLAKTTNELGTELESLKYMFDMKQEIFFKSAIKGMAAEEDILEFLVNFINNQKLKDTAHLSGNTPGAIPKNKTGDIICHIDGEDSTRIAIECKFDKSIRLGDISTKEVFANKTDTAWSQLIEAEANREGKSSIIVFDISVADNSIVTSIQNVRYIASIGFVVLVDSQKGDYSNLAIAYMLARDIAIKARPVELDKDLLAALINRLVKDIDGVLSIKTLVESNIINCKNILGQLEKSMLLMEFNRKFFTRFLSEGTLTKNELLEFYYADVVKEQYKMIEKDIKSL